MFAVVLYLVAVVSANLLVARFGADVTVFNAFVLIAFNLSARDYLHNRWHGNNLYLKTGALVLAGSVLSYLLNADAASIAVASFCAFSVSGLLDTFVYERLFARPYLQKSNASNLVSAFSDSLVFPILAFGFPPLWGIVTGQFVAKVVGGFVWSLVLDYAKKRNSHS